MKQIINNCLMQLLNRLKNVKLHIRGKSLENY